MTWSRSCHAMWLLVALLTATYLFLHSGLDFDYVIPGRLTRIAAIIIGGVSVAVSAIIFQTITGNRILTPAIMGYEAIYLLLQSLLILILGTRSLIVVGDTGNFILSILCMLAYGGIVQHWLFRDGRANIHVLLLVGLVLTMAIGTVAQFIQLVVSPGEYAILQGFSFASFHRARPEQLFHAGLIVSGACLVAVRTLPTLDVIALGRDQAVSLGVDWQKHVRLQLALIAVLVAISTSLLGPTAFMGIFVANISYALARTVRHRVTLPLGTAIAIAIFLAAQLFVEQLFDNRTTVGILVNLLCGTYFLALMLRGRGIA